MSAPIFTRRHYCAIADLIRDAGYVEPETRAQLVLELSELFAGDNERFQPERFRAAARVVELEPEYIVVENTPGYLPDDDDLPVFETYAAAVEYANERADEYEHDPDGNYNVDRSYASRENTYCVVVHDRDRMHDLGRVIEVLRSEP
jgi:hypothetical protein